VSPTITGASRQAQLLEAAGSNANKRTTSIITDTYRLKDKLPG